MPGHGSLQSSSSSCGAVLLGGHPGEAPYCPGSCRARIIVEASAETLFLDHGPGDSWGCLEHVVGVLATASEGTVPSARVTVRTLTSSSCSWHLQARLEVAQVCFCFVVLQAACSRLTCDKFLSGFFCGLCQALSYLPGLFWCPARLP